ncbi:MAG: hypothetical protein WCT77_10090, partial [Bacteroidota bacterium]
IHQKANEHGITMGYHEVHPTPEKIKQLICEGMRFIACGMDTIFLLEKSSEFAKMADIKTFTKLNLVKV